MNETNIFSAYTAVNYKIFSIVKIMDWFNFSHWTWVFSSHGTIFWSIFFVKNIFETWWEWSNFCLKKVHKYAICTKCMFEESRATHVQNASYECPSDLVYQGYESIWHMCTLCKRNTPKYVITILYSYIYVSSQRMWLKNTFMQLVGVFCHIKMNI